MATSTLRIATQIRHNGPSFAHTSFSGTRLHAPQAQVRAKVLHPTLSPSVAPHGMCVTPVIRSIFSGFAAPPINDISTDLADPPQFTSVSRGRLPNSYKRQIEKGYPDLKSLEVQAGKDVVFDAAVAVAKSMSGWEVTYEDKGKGAIEGVATTFLLRFKDDFVIRIAGRDGGTVIDMRSKSRVGQADFGANANRIKEYFKVLRSKL